MTVTPFKDFPLADRDRPWDGSAAEKRVRRWTGADDKPNAKFRDAHVWYDSADKDEFGAYKLPIADVIDDKIQAVPRAIMAAGAVMRARGTIDHVPVYPREVVKRALELSATALILAHNHPSGDPKPSSADIRVTQEIAKVASPLGILVHDHIIVGRNGHVSLKEMKLF